MIVIGIQFPYAMVVGWEFFGNKEESGLGFNSLVLHLLLISIEIENLNISLGNTTRKLYV